MSMSMYSVPFPWKRTWRSSSARTDLYKSLPDGDLRDLYLQSGGPRGAAQSLALEAYGNGSDDNISVAIVEFGEVPREITVGTMPLEFEGSDEAEARTIGTPTAQATEHEGESARRGPLR